MGIPDAGYPGYGWDMSEELFSQDNKQARTAPELVE